MPQSTAPMPEPTIHQRIQIPSRLSPIPFSETSHGTSLKRKLSRCAVARAVKMAKTTHQFANDSDDELPEASQISLTRESRSRKGKAPARLSQPIKPMSGSPSKRVGNTTIQKTPGGSTSRKTHHEPIIIDSTDEDENEPAALVTQASAAAGTVDIINISDSESDNPPPARSPDIHAQLYTEKISSTSAMLSRKSPTPPLIPLASAPVHIEQVLPPIPSPTLELTVSQTHPDSVNLPNSPAPQNVVCGSNSDSGSSGDVLESVVRIGPGERSFILSSSSSTSADTKNASPKDIDEDVKSQSDHDQREFLTSPRGRGPSHSSPSGDSRSGPATEAELEESIAEISLQDPQPNLRADNAIAQTVAAVNSIALGDDSERDQNSASEACASISAPGPSGNGGLMKCTVGGCGFSFNTAGQLHTHMNRDHGIRFSQETNKVTKGKRKASNLPATPTKRRTHTPISRNLSSRASPQALGSSEHSANGIGPSSGYVERTNTIGFEPFVQTLSDQGSSSSLEHEHIQDQIVVSDGSPSPPHTPPPQAPKMRAPQPNARPSVPDSPSAHLSPSKQLAQNKHEVLIPGEPLETWRVDLVNSMPESYRNGPGARVVFEALMDEMMRETEPCASGIVIKNVVDQQPCPPWEFVYCNKVLYGENVPRPDQNALAGCDCLGSCNPDNRKCACVQRQEAYFADNENVSEFTGFAFNTDGTIKYHNGAAFGCNSKCSCDLDCPNKVWQQGRKHAISLKKTKEKGWGVFAEERIPAGAYLGVYTGELLTEGIANKRAQIYDEFGRTYLLNIDFQHLNSDHNAPEYAVDAFHAGNFTRFLNHSCRPNLCLSALYVEDPDIRKPWLTLFSDRIIKAGEELTFSYTGMDVDDPEDQAKAEQAKRAARKEKTKRGKVFEECLCGAEGCFGIIFNANDR